MPLIPRSYPELIASPIFRGITEDDVFDLLECAGARLKSFSAGERIYKAGDSDVKVGVIASGSSHAEREDVFGNRVIIGTFKAGDVLCASFACASKRELPISVLARTACDVVMLDPDRVVNTCSSECKKHHALIRNMLRVIAEHDLELDEKMEILTARTTRAKLGAFLTAEARRASSPKFAIQLNRSELADYLAVDRSAMSSELSRMKRDGLIDFDRTSFTLLRSLGY